MKTKKWKYEIKFTSRITCAIAVLELILWGVSPEKYSVYGDDNDYYLHTSNNNVLDIIGESITPSQYTINTPV
jgi:hypothetical protein